MSSELPDSPLKITIIGAGIAGLSAALALSNANPTHEITILESNPSLSEFGAGIQLSANSARLLDKWGMTQSLRAVAFEAAHMSARRWQDNTELASIPHNPVSTWLYGWPHWQIYRPDLQRVLYDGVAKLPNVRVLFGKAVTHVDHVTGTVRTADTVLEADLAVGADGIWSKTRRFLPATQDVRPTPYREHTYRSVIPRSRMLSNPITAPLMSAPESKAWLGPYNAVLGYTVASDSLYNFIISVPRPNPDVPLASWNEPGDLAMMRGLVDGWCEEVQALASLVQEGECAVWTLGEVLAVPSYVSESGRVVLIGDAAHAILPHAGQGGGMAIEDAASLVEFLGCMGSRDDLGRTMSAWSEFRQTRVEHLREIARSNADALTFPDGPSQVARDAKWAAIIQVQQA
ncbi:uncharacterized protein N7498_004451 [Penicillium cinerascens]|uniref:FAD-binding domain-containing protein n=1 Tax=Penicillium cinerascens TaxID=70096 RepID=A0A9W9N461_9EURO|nr:uncharacterized protein N7498_004451 [Penicillium cinerascens]KAJ5212805.1 hypothetical protein N7498_004451 [Penicillium cinerascens]